LGINLPPVPALVPILRGLAPGLWSGGRGRSLLVPRTIDAIGGGIVPLHVTGERSRLRLSGAA